MTPAKNEPKCHREESLLLVFCGWMDDWWGCWQGKVAQEMEDWNLEPTRTFVCVTPHLHPYGIKEKLCMLDLPFFLAYGVQQHYSYVTLSTNWKTNKWCEFPHKMKSQRFQPFQVLNQINVFFTSWSRSFLLLHGGGQRMITSHLKHNWGDY